MIRGPRRRGRGWRLELVAVAAVACGAPRGDGASVRTAAPGAGPQRLERADAGPDDTGARDEGPDAGYASAFRELGSPFEVAVVVCRLTRLG